MSQPTTVVIAGLSVALAVTAGCKSYGPEACCPTDARRIILSCAGEEAVRKGPCGPDGAYYGHHATCWSSWPVGWEQRKEEECLGAAPCVEVAEPIPAASHEPYQAPYPAPTEVGYDDLVPPAFAAPSHRQSGDDSTIEEVRPTQNSLPAPRETKEAPVVIPPLSDEAIWNQPAFAKPEAYAKSMPAVPPQILNSFVPPTQPSQTTALRDAPKERVSR